MFIKNRKKRKEEERREGRKGRKEEGRKREREGKILNIYEMFMQEDFLILGLILYIGNIMVNKNEKTESRKNQIKNIDS